MTKPLTYPITASPQGLPPARPTDPLRSPRRRRTFQPGQQEDEPQPDRTQPHSHPSFATGRWC
ncbi:hypothetical protein F0P96_04720 [Hymenobacter busanensis]|uniref:Uncharacterized protein n=1 Tax=Hymenobacter busanensis TaxID=2607656 RepID=A0A7L5A4Y9_9BACT|nr:hypothetical protein [Hymenobacter busanensis]KAA9338155.1 hypothetical protein F0P96_04720 [Hymenobacter busanensis]QHJ09420.1 hypothetical protein GUY19_19890 [Hymenobacter busanensis]